MKAIKSSSKLFFIACIIALGMVSCRNKISGSIATQDINTGKITMYADETYTKLINELIKSYENVYDSANIQIQYMPEQAVISALLSDSIRMVILGRMLTADEIEKIRQLQEVSPQQHVIAHDAIAIVAGRQNNDSVFDLDEFIRSRNANAATEKYAKTNFIFDTKKSSALNYMLSATGIKGPSLNNMYALNNKDEFIKYLTNDTSAIGFISFAEISDREDTSVMRFFNKIKILSVSATDSTGIKKIFNLSQANIALNAYPLQRPVNVVLGNIPQRLGTGFVTFAYKQKAAKIFLKAGLVPAVMPERMFTIQE